MINISQPTVIPVSTIVTDLTARLGAAAPSATNLRVSINMAISAMGEKLLVPYYVPITFVADTAAYNLTSMFVGRNAIPQVIRYDVGSYESLTWWALADNYLRVDPGTRGSGRIICFTPQPLLPATNYTLAEHVDDGATAIWLNGRIDGLPIAGWLALDGDVWFYRGWQHSNAPERLFTDLAAAAADAEGDLYVSDTALYPVYDMAPGIYTKLNNVARWPYQLVGEVHDPADVAEPCLAFTNEALYDALILGSTINAYSAKIHACAAPEDKSLYSSLMANAQQQYAIAYKRVNPPRAGKRIHRNQWQTPNTYRSALDA